MWPTLARVVALCNSGRELGLVPVPFMDGGLLMRRTLLVMATTMSFAVLVIGGVAYALTPVQCDGAGDQNPALGTCWGTEASDNITGTSRADVIHAKAADDIVDALGGNDSVRGGGESDTLHGGDGGDVLSGDGANVPERDGQDYIYGEGGQDTLDGEGGDNRYFGDADADTIDAAFSTQDGPNAAAGEIISGGPGNDTIYAGDGLSDTVNCGPGKDRVKSHDPADEIATDCEF
jgi:Ca2+-binding RTX toxin-like protein